MVNVLQKQNKHSAWTLLNDTQLKSPEGLKLTKQTSTRRTVVRATGREAGFSRRDGKNSR